MLAEILAQVNKAVTDLGVVKDATTRLDERMKTTVDASVDHEARIRALEAAYISKATARWWVGIALSLAVIASGIVAALISAN